FIAKPKDPEIETEGVDLSSIKPLETDDTASASELPEDELGLEENTEKELTEDLDELRKLE
ncbi:MAG TPA: hypothetical protein VLR89_02915, partial [Anaerolineaceae bacterium]|nr:hypothetical protein [Anaerolineaceae bacterium]